MKKKQQKIDLLIVIPYVLLCLIGILMVLSASSFNLMTVGAYMGSKFLKQSLFVCMGFITAYFFYRVKLEVLFTKTLISLYMLISLLLLLIVSYTPLGIDVGGAKRWIPLGGINIQPSEIVNVIFILYLANYLSKHPVSEPLKERYRKPLIICFTYILLVALQPNVAGAAMLLILLVTMLLASGVPVLLSVGVGALGMALRSLITFVALKINRQFVPVKYRYLLVRFELMGNPFLDEFDKGYQTSNSYYAMYNGGFWGRGYGQSLQKKNRLPAADTDFIFSVTIEELGLVVSMLILFLPFLIVLRTFYLGIIIEDSRKSLCCFGIGMVLLLQVSVNVGSLLGYIPMTGVTFPFVSYGGSSVIILSSLIGIVLNISRWQNKSVIMKEEKMN